MAASSVDGVIANLGSELIDGLIKDGKIGHYQVTLKIGFTLETQ